MQYVHTKIDKIDRDRLTTVQMYNHQQPTTSKIIPCTPCRRQRADMQQDLQACKLQKDAMLLLLLLSLLYVRLLMYDGDSSKITFEGPPIIEDAMYQMYGLQKEKQQQKLEHQSTDNHVRK